MIADGILLTTYAGSSVDFKNGDNVVAYIPRDYYNKTTATLYCAAGVFGSLYEYVVSYLGWDEPSMPSVVAIPALPQPVNGSDRTLYLRKGDGSNWTEDDVRNLEIKVGNDTCDVVPTETGVDFSLTGTVYCSITGSSISGKKIPIVCHGETGEQLPMDYTITSITIKPYLIVDAELPFTMNIGAGIRGVRCHKSDNSKVSSGDLLSIKIKIDGITLEAIHGNVYAYAMPDGSGQYAWVYDSSVGARNFEIEFIGANESTGIYTVEDIKLG